MVTVNFLRMKNKTLLCAKLLTHDLKLYRWSIPWCVSLRQDCGQVQGHAQRKTQQNWMILRWWRRPRDWSSVPCFTPSPSAPVGRITRTTHRQNGQEPGINVTVRLSAEKLLDKDGELFPVLTNTLHIVSIQNIIYLNQDKLGTRQYNKFQTTLWILKKLNLIVPALSLEWHLMEHSMLEEQLKS